MKTSLAQALAGGDNGTS
jgi:hypothetical protein